MNIQLTDLQSLLQYLYFDPARPLLFNSVYFLILFILFYSGYLLVLKTKYIKLLYVVFFSLFFYYKTSGIFFTLLIQSTIIDYLIGVLMQESRKKWIRRLLLFFSISSNLGMLFYFKYTNFFIENFNLLNLSQLNPVDVFLPVGISFYTFQTLSYSIDVYRKDVRAEYNLLRFAFYVSFFPQLVAGPIVRARDFLPQLRKSIPLSNGQLNRGLLLIGGGLFKKAVISDYISINFVDRIFEAPGLYTGIENLFGVYAYAIQIYCDFSGYSDMAIGLALIMGFTLPDNFNLPYKSASITEFWRRWHISLSTWLRDYLYISMGGNRKGKFRTHLHLLMTMFLGGLWHGASWNFVLWGLFHGLLLVLERVVGIHKESGKPMSLLKRVGRVLLTFHLVCFSWIFFRAESFEMGVNVLTQIFTAFHPGVFLQLIQGYSLVMALLAVGFILHFLPSHWHISFESKMKKAPVPVMAFYLAIIIWISMQTASSEVQPFIYFQF